MRNSPLLAAFTLLMAGSFTVSAQRARVTTTPQPTSTRIALASATEATTEAAAAPAEAARIACTKIDGQVLDLDGKPLVGATVTVKGTSHLYITNGEGRYLIEVPVYQGQLLEVEAAGYTTREVALVDCTAPAIGLEMAAGTRVKKKGKRAGQIVRFGTAQMQ